MQVLPPDALTSAGPCGLLPLGDGAAVAFSFTLFSGSLGNLPFCSHTSSWALHPISSSVDRPDTDFCQQRLLNPDFPQ